MPLAATIVVALMGCIQVFILVLEMFLWEESIALKAFKQTPEEAKATKVLAGNQGLYNGFLAAGLFWGASLGAAGTSIRVFFLSCVLIAGIYGAITAVPKTLLIQSLPALIGLALVLLS
jgi:putative membrane protein